MPLQPLKMNQEPGTILKMDHESFEVACQSGSINILGLQDSNGHIQDFSELTKNEQLEIGTRLPILEDVEKDRLH